MSPSQQAECANPALETIRPWQAAEPVEPAAGRRLLDRWISRFRLWRELDRSRRHLATLDERQLKDLGLTRSEIWHEIDKPFWRP